jgi:hypothetical protein
MKKKGDRQVPNCVPVSEQELEEDLKKWFREKWVRFGPDGKIRGECGGRDSGEGKPKCLPAGKAHALGKKGRSSSAAKKRREDPDPERRGPARNVATRTRSMKEQGYQEHEPPQEQQSGSNILKGIGTAMDLYTRRGRFSPDALSTDAQQELTNQLRDDPSSKNLRGTSTLGNILNLFKK